MAQYISRVGLALDGNTGESLIPAKQAWMQDEAWQGLRKLCETSLIEQDYFKLFLLQNLVIDSFMSELVYTQFDQWLAQHQARDLAMLMEFMQEAMADLRKWSDSVFKTAAAESAEALSADAVDIAEQKLLERSKKIGIELEQILQA